MCCCRRSWTSQPCEACGCFGCLFGNGDSRTATTRLAWLEHPTQSLQRHLDMPLNARLDLRHRSWQELGSRAVTSPSPGHKRDKQPAKKESKFDFCLHPRCMSLRQLDQQLKAQCSNVRPGGGYLISIVMQRSTGMATTLGHLPYIPT